MAADIGLSAAKYLLQSGLQTISYYWSVLSEAQKELKQLSNELNLMIKFVETYGQTTGNTPFFQEWVKQIRDVITEVEDTVITCAVQAESEKNSNLVSRVFKLKGKIGLAEQVKELLDGVKPVLDNIMKGVFPSQPISADVSQGPTGETRAGWKRDLRLEIIGLQDVKQNLINDLTSEKQERNVFAIVGMPGLGKTSLAWHIHHHSEITKKYPDNIWVDVSQEFNKHDVLQAIAVELKKNDTTFVVPGNVSFEDLSDKVCAKLKLGKYLIIFDDVWTIAAWKEIEKFLPHESNKQCKLLITTRDHELVRYATGNRNIESLRYLNGTESWDLLKSEVFGATECPKDMEPSGRRIAELCCGLPLAIVVIGGVLSDMWKVRSRNKEARDRWEVVSKSMETYLIDGKATSDGRNNEKILAGVISKSYDCLSNELKECFLYLGMFPVDTEIPVRKLTWLWVAEGFIQPVGVTSPEETAQEYVNQLINKNLIKVEIAKPDGSAKSCRVHDWIRNFCKEKAVDHSFQEIIKKSGKFDPADDKIQNCRVISIHSSLGEFLKRTKTSLKVRSFLSFSKEKIEWDYEKKEMPSIKKTFNFLRVLDVHMAIKFQKIPDDLTQLVLLKYITLSSDEFKVVPKDMYKLWNVETLEVHTLSPTLKVKAEIWKMRRLRHFKTNASIILDKLDIIERLKGKGKSDGGENLVTLSRLSPESCTSEVFTSNANNIRELGIRGDLRKLLLVDTGCLHNLENLEKMKLLHDGKVPKETMGGVPEPEWFPKNLKTLVFTCTYLEWKHISTLAKIPTLKFLKLKKNAVTGKIWSAGPDDNICFSSLESLHILDADLAVWTTTGESFPSLKDLVLKNCKQLIRVPPQFTELEILHLDTVNKNAVTSAYDLQEAILKELDANKTDNRGEFKLVILPREDDYKLMASLKIKPNSLSFKAL